MKPPNVVAILATLAMVACAPPPATRAASEAPVIYASAKGISDTDDGVLRRAVKTALQADPGLDGALIAVSARDGEVTLAGVVMSPAQRLRAHELAATTRGVRGVDNVLEVEPAR